MTDPPRQSEAESKVGWRMAGIGMEVAAQVAAGALLGWLADRWQGTSGRWLLVGAIVGIIVGLWTLIRGTIKLNRQLDRQFPTAGRGKPLNDDQWNDDNDDEDDWTADRGSGGGAEP